MACFPEVYDLDRLGRKLLGHHSSSCFHPGVLIKTPATPLAACCWVARTLRLINRLDSADSLKPSDQQSSQCRVGNLRVSLFSWLQSVTARRNRQSNRQFDAITDRTAIATERIHFRLRLIVINLIVPSIEALMTAGSTVWTVQLLDVSWHVH